MTLHFVSLGASFVELINREFCLTNIFAKQYITDHTPAKMHTLCMKFGWYKPNQYFKQIFLTSSFSLLSSSIKFGPERLIFMEVKTRWCHLIVITVYWLTSF